MLSFLPLIVIGIISFFLLFMYVYLLKDTIFGVNNNNFLGFFIFLDLFIFILPAILLLNTLPISDFWVAFKVKQTSVFFISILILLSLIFFYFFLKLISSFFFKKYFTIEFDTNIYNIKNIKFFVNLSIVFCIISMILLFFAFGIKHALISGILNNESISIYRAQIRENHLGKTFGHLFLLIGPFLSAIIASPVYKKTNFQRWILFFFILIISSWAGNKGVIIKIFLSLFISFLTFNNYKLNMKLIIRILFFITFIFFIIHQIVILQYPQLNNLDSFFNYFSQRVFVAQLIGTYEEFNLWINNFEYIWHGVPFMSYITDHHMIFQKDLMMISEDRLDPNSIGIKNTLFVAEAYAMGGWLFVIIAPIWMAINFSLSYVFIVFLMNKFVFKNLSYSKKIVAIGFFAYVSITGGFSDLMFFKITIMIVILLFPFLFFNYLFRCISSKKFINKDNI